MAVFGYLVNPNSTSKTVAIDLYKHLLAHPTKPGAPIAKMVLLGKTLGDYLNDANPHLPSDLKSTITRVEAQPSHYEATSRGSKAVGFSLDFVRINQLLSDYSKGGRDVVVAISANHADIKAFFETMAYFNAGVGVCISNSTIDVNGEHLAYSLAGYNRSVTRLAIGVNLPPSLYHAIDYVNYAEDGMSGFVKALTPENFSDLPPARIEDPTERNEFAEELRQCMRGKTVKSAAKSATHTKKVKKRSKTKTFFTSLTLLGCLTILANGFFQFIPGVNTNMSVLAGLALGIIVSLSLRNPMGNTAFFKALEQRGTSDISSVRGEGPMERSNSAEELHQHISSKNVSAAKGKDWTEAWETVEARHHKITQDWLAYEMDLALSLDYPLMIDVSVPQTSALHRAVVKAGDLRDHVDRNVNPVDTSYYEAVQDLVVAFEAAEQNARKVGNTLWTREERRKVDTARQLLRIAEDESASTEERSTAFKQASRNIEGIWAFPEKGERRLTAAIGLIER